MNVTFVFDDKGNRKLYKILNLEEVDIEKYDRLFYHYYVKFTSDVDACEITQHLLSQTETVLG